jgi:hypothetical protein
MTITDLTKDLSDAIRSLDRGDRVAAARVERWAAALDRTERDHPDPGSRRFRATQLRTRAAQDSAANLKTEIAIVLAKLAHWRSLDPEQASDE